MADNDLKSLVEKFAAALEDIVTRRANEAFGAKFDVVRKQVLGGGAAPARGAVTPKARVGRPPKSGSVRPIADKPCPVCGKPNKGRRYSFLCEEHRTKENLAKFKGASRKAPAVAAGKRGLGRPRKAVAPSAAAPASAGPEADAPSVPEAAPKKRGPGRTKKAK